MPSKVNWFVALCLLSLSGSLAAEGLPPLTHGLTALTTPFQAPALRLQDMDEEIVDINDMKGKIVIVNFWATWCPPCRREMASLERLYLSAADKNIVVLAVNVGEDIDTVFSFLGTVEPSPTFPIIMDKTSDSLKDWKVRGLPTTYVVDASGMVRYRAVGGREFDHPDLVKNITALHGEK
ncbi:MAG: TlpA family protein disulfide reductase [Gammaproteobacteria bacterium]|nr:TlpA family protein disulfide reductase [Gammaproteobacteria bacterium]